MATEAEAIQIGIGLIQLAVLFIIGMYMKWFFKMKAHEVRVNYHQDIKAMFPVSKAPDSPTSLEKELHKREAALEKKLEREIPEIEEFKRGE